MPKNDYHEAYYTLIGKFVHLCAKIEYAVTTCSVLKENHERQMDGVAVVIRIEEKLTDKLHRKILNIENIIQYNGNQSTKPKELDEVWATLKPEILDIMNERQFLIHGTGLSFFFDEPIKSSIVEHGKKELTTKRYMLSDIMKLNERAYQLLYGVDGLEQKLIYLYGAWITGGQFWLTAHNVPE